MKVLLIIGFFALNCGLLSAQHHHDCPSCDGPDKKAEVEAIQKVFSQAKGIMVFEGLPHPYEEEALLKAELKRKDTVKLPPLEEPFYTPALKASNEEALRKALSGPDCISVYKAHKCGFHADYCLQWQHHGVTYTAMFCFGCADMAVTHGDTTQYFSFNRNVLKPLLAVYDKKRPKKEQAE